MQPVNLTINSLQHIGLPVTNMINSVTFYEGLGFTKVMEEPFIHHGETGTAVMMKRESIIMELYELPAKDLTEIRNRKDGHIDHVAFDVTDIDETFLF